VFLLLLRRPAGGGVEPPSHTKQHAVLRGAPRFQSHDRRRHEISLEAPANRAGRAKRYFVCCCRRRSIVSAVCSCSSAILVKPLLRKRLARARCHSGVSRKSSSRGFTGLSSVDIVCRLEGGRTPTKLPTKSGPGGAGPDPPQAPLSRSPSCAARPLSGGGIFWTSWSGTYGAITSPARSAESSRDRPRRRAVCERRFPVRDGAVAQLEISGAAPAAAARGNPRGWPQLPSISTERRSCSTSDVASARMRATMVHRPNQGQRTGIWRNPTISRRIVVRHRGAMT
jgi:hypothetical protein